MVVKLYYTVDKESSIYESYMSWKKNADEVESLRSAFMDEHKVIEGTTYSNGSIRSLVFAEGADIPAGLKTKAKEPSNQYFTDRRTKVGKAMSAKFSSFAQGSPDEATMMLEHEAFIEMGSGGMGMWHATLHLSKSGVLTATVPVKDNMSYTAQDGMSEISSSEFKSIIEDSGVNHGS